MAVIVGILYFVVLSVVLTYAVGGVGFGIAIVLLLAYLAVNELWKAYKLGDHPEIEEHPKRHRGHDARSLVPRR
jgi:hypothetical protein